MIYIICASITTFNVPCSYDTPHPTLLTSQVDCHLNLISSWVNPTVIVLCDSIAVYNHNFYHDDDLDPVPCLKVHPSGWIIYLLLLQYSNFHTTLMPPKFTIMPVLLASSTTTTSHSSSRTISSWAAFSIGCCFAWPDWTFHFFASTMWKKGTLTIVDVHVLAIFHTNFPLTQFLFHYLFYSLLLSLSLLIFWFPFHA